MFSNPNLDKNKTILFNFFRSSASWRIRIILALKQIPYEYHAINLLEKEQLKADFLKINPQGQVPALWIDGQMLTESVAIAEYLEETRPGPVGLLPKDPIERAVVRKIVEHVNSGMQPMQNLRLLDKIDSDFKGDKVEWATYWNKRGHDALEEILKTTAGKYAVGDALTLADVFVYPQMHNGISRYGVRKDDYVHLKRVFDNLLELEDFRNAEPDKQPDSKKKTN
jgi:maleylacetoacetate isomerase